MPNEAQNLTMLSYVDFSGGENSSVPPTSLQDNEFQVIRNLEFLFNKLVTRGGLSEPLATMEFPIKAMYYCEGMGDTIVVLENKSIYHVGNDFSINVVEGTVSGNKKPCFCEFDGRIFIASGDKLQYLDFVENTLTTIEASHICDVVIERFGRLVTTVAGDDNLYYSSVGDAYETGWEDDSNDDSSSKFLEIGYKDSADIITVVPVAGDLAIFKDNGRVYSVSNEYPNWTVQQIAEHTDAINQQSIAVVNGTVAFMTHLGLKTLQTTAVYGNFTTDELARKINRSLSANVKSPKIYNIVRKRQLVVFPDTSSDEALRHCFCYQYDIGAGIEMEFAVPIYDMQDTPNGVLVASGNSIYRWSMEYDTDNGEPIEQQIVSKKYATSNRLYTRMVDIGVEGTVGEKVTMTWANKTVRYEIPKARRMIHVFSVCRESVFGLYTTAKISLEYIKLYIFEQ